MKKLLALVLLSALMLLPSCQRKPVSAPLSVYLVETDALYTAALKEYAAQYPDRQMELEAFGDVETMAARLEEELAAGEGPDVVLLNSLQGNIDAYALAKSGGFRPLEDFMDTLPEGKYLAAVLDAGKVDGEQFFLPLSWNIPQCYARADIGAEPDGGMDEVLAAEAEALAGEEGAALCSLNFLRQDILNLMLETGGVSLIDPEGRLFVDDDGFRQAAETVRLFYQNLDQIQVVSGRYRNDFAGAASHLSFLLENYPFMQNLRYYQTVYPRLLGEEMRFRAFDRPDGGLTAQVIEYAAVNQNTQEAEEAWQLLAFLLDYPCPGDFPKYETSAARYAPVNLEAYEACVQQLETQTGQGSKMDLEPLTAENAGLLRQIPGRVAGAVIPNPALGEILQGCMGPYFSGEMEFEDCYLEFLAQAEAYLGP